MSHTYSVTSIPDKPKAGADLGQQDAITALNTLQSNFETIDAIRKSGRGMNKNAISEMRDWVRRIGYEVCAGSPNGIAEEPAQSSDFDQLKVIHIAGTKGKGSTSAFISSILGQCLPSRSQVKPLLHKIGLYTSPHLRFVRERIQINNEPLSEDVFAKYFFEVWDRLENAARERGEPTSSTAKPVYFRFLTLMAFHTYMSEGVDTAVIECGIGGEYDSTNILISPSVTGITSLGIDHTAMLGTTIEEIAWHKAGIMKTGVPCFTAPQPPAGLEVLQKRAADAGVTLEVVGRHPQLGEIKLGLAADFQRTNASLAIAIAKAHLTSLGYSEPMSPLPAEFVRGLEEVSWPGRCEIRREKNVAWYIDSGHTLESIDVAGSWFASQIPSTTALPMNQRRILLFNQQTRDADALARALYRTLAAVSHQSKPFTHAVFCANVTFKDTGFRPDLQSMNVNAKAVEGLKVQKSLAATWKAIDAETTVEVRSTIEEAVQWCREVACHAEVETMVLVTGSVHLVGGFLEVLETDTGYDHATVASKPC
ncbi:MAG: hypothetical protein Q9163_003890 [Psora crenata]